MGGWMPGATIMRGRNAGYRVGRVTKASTVCHYTVGIDSAGIGVNGYFQFLIRRNGEIVQFAESDAVCWHAGNWNSRGPGIEIEYYEPKDGPHPENIFTEPQLEADGRLVRWLAETDGYPLDFYDGSRVSAHRGFITHRSLIQSGDAHHDYWSRDQWDRMVAGAPSPVSHKPTYKEQSMFVATIPNGNHVLVGDSFTSDITEQTGNVLAFKGVPQVEMSQSVLGKIADDIAKRNPTADEIADAVKRAIG